MGQYVWVFLGGGLGALARFALVSWIIRWTGTGFPVGNLLINVSGSLAVGALLFMLTERFETDPAWRLFLVVGFLGGYTTFSSYSFEAIALLISGEWPRAAWYVLGSNGLSLLGCFAGIVIARLLMGVRA